MQATLYSAGGALLIALMRASQAQSRSDHTHQGPSLNDTLLVHQHNRSTVGVFHLFFTLFVTAQCNSSLHCSVTAVSPPLVHLSCALLRNTHSFVFTQANSSSNLYRVVQLLYCSYKQCIWPLAWLYCSRAVELRPRLSTCCPVCWHYCC